MPSPSKYLLIEERLGRPLADQLGRWQTARISIPAMARLLTLETGVPVSPSGVRLWVNDLKADAS